MHYIVNGYRKKNGQAKGAVKVDLMKAYSTVKWDFLFAVMDCMNFPETYIQWVRKGVCMARFSLNMNGALAGYFSSTRGLRRRPHFSISLSFSNGSLFSLV